MNRKLVICLFMTSLSFCSFGQTNNVKVRILDNADSKSEIISKGRRLLLDKFIEGDFNKVKEIKDYLEHDVANEDYIALFPVELWLILYSTHEYTELTISLKEFESSRATFYKKINPQRDALLPKLLEKTRESKQSLIASIKNSDAPLIDQDFLIMNLDHLIMSDDYPGINHETLNGLADRFLANYPNSEYENYVRQNIRQKFVLSKWGYGVEFFSGYGIFTNDLAKNYENNVPIGVAFDVYYKNVAFYLRDYIGFSKTRNDVSYGNGTWKKGSQVRVFLPEISVGYVVIDNKLVKLAPFAGISWMDIGPTQYDVTKTPDLDKVDLSFTTTYTAGLNFDLKLGRSKIAMVTQGPEQSYWLLRFRYAFNLPQFEKKYNDFSGNMHYITIGIGGFGRKMKREY